MTSWAMKECRMKRGFCMANNNVGFCMSTWHALFTFLLPRANMLAFFQKTKQRGGRKLFVFLASDYKSKRSKLIVPRVYDEYEFYQLSAQAAFLPLVSVFAKSLPQRRKVHCPVRPGRLSVRMRPQLPWPELQR